MPPSKLSPLFIFNFFKENYYLTILLNFRVMEYKEKKIQYDDAEMFTSEIHDPYARTTGAWK